MALNTNSTPRIAEYNSVNLLTTEPTKDDKAYLVDKRLVDFLVDKVRLGSLDDIKNDIRSRVNVCETKEELFKELDNYIYIDRVINLLPKEEIVEEKTVLPVGNSTTNLNLCFSWFILFNNNSIILK